jgi:hypothetical protein
MSNEMPPPKRKESDLTLRIDRALLPPISRPALASCGLDPNHPESESLIAADLDEDDVPTLGPCRRCIDHPCPCCGGLRLVTRDVAAKYEATKALLTTLSDPEDEPA